MPELGKFHCKLCFQDCEGEGVGVRDTRLCRDCAQTVGQQFCALLGLEFGPWDDMGLTIEWPDIIRLMLNIEHNPAMRYTVLTDRNRYMMERQIA